MRQYPPSINPLFQQQCSFRLVHSLSQQNALLELFVFMQSWSPVLSQYPSPPFFLSWTKSLDLLGITAPPKKLVQVKLLSFACVYDKATSARAPNVDQAIVFYFFSYWYVAQSCHCLNNLYLPTSIRITRWICYPSYWMHFFDRVKVSFFSTHSTPLALVQHFLIILNPWALSKRHPNQPPFSQDDLSPHLFLQSSPIPSSYTKVLVLFRWTIKTKKKKRGPKALLHWTNFFLKWSHSKMSFFFCIQSHDAIFKLQERHIQMHTLKKKKKSWLFS